MADLTPPSSKPSTPMRPVEPPQINAPPSPSQIAGGSTQPVFTSSAVEKGDIDMEQLDDESDSTSAIEEIEEDAAASDEEMTDGSEAAEQGEGAGADEPSLRSKLKNVFRAESRKKKPLETGSKRPRARKGKAKELDEPTIAGKRGKDAEFESHIVARWNKEFGDVLLQPPTQRPAQQPAASTAA